MAFIDQAALANDATFISRVKIAMLTAAVQISAESQGATHTAIEDKRQRLAGEVLRTAGDSTLQAFVWATVTNAVITGSSLDSDIQFEVNSVWNAIANVRASD